MHAKWNRNITKTSGIVEHIVKSSFTPIDQRIYSTQNSKEVIQIIQEAKTPTSKIRVSKRDPHDKLILSNWFFKVQTPISMDSTSGNSRKTFNHIPLHQPKYSRDPSILNLHPKILKDLSDTISLSWLADQILKSGLADKPKN